MIKVSQSEVHLKYTFYILTKTTYDTTIYSHLSLYISHLSCYVVHDFFQSHGNSADRHCNIAKIKNKIHIWHKIKLI